MIRFTVPGIPAPQGSKRYLGTKGGKGILVESSKRVAPWRADVMYAAIGAHDRQIPGALSVTLDFRLPRPKGHHGVRGLRPSAPRFPTTKPDLDKLARAVLDALKGIVWIDDSQVVELHASKDYGDPGVDIQIRQMKEQA